MNFQGTAILCVYCQPRDTYLRVKNSLNRFISDYNLPMILLDDFKELLDSSHTSAAGRSLREFCEFNGLA